MHLNGKGSYEYNIDMILHRRVVSTYEVRESELNLGVTFIGYPCSSSSGTMSKNVRVDAAARKSIG